MSTGRVTALYRYPIKSMQGERVEAIDVTPDGVTGDRSLCSTSRPDES